jgi:RNA polymerase sigma factor (sigma-70 family)
MSASITRVQVPASCPQPDEIPVTRDSEGLPEFRNREAPVGSNAGGLDNEALEACRLADLYSHYADDVRRTVSSTLKFRNSADRDDVCQTVFEKVIEAFKDRKIRVGESGEIRAYVRTIARNVSLDWYRRQQRETPVEDLSEFPVPDHVPRLEYDLALALLESCLLKMPREIDVLYRFRFVRRYSQDRTAAELGISRQQLRTIETRFKQELRRSMLAAGLEW